MSTKKMFKLFSSRIKECEWLNSLGNKGYLLASLKDNVYTFDISEEHTYCYSVEYLDCSPQSDTAHEYFKKYADDAVMPVMASGGWVYFVKEDSSFTPDAAAYKKNSAPYFRKMIYHFFFGFSACIISGYQVFMIDFLRAFGDPFSTPVIPLCYISAGEKGILTLLKNIANMFLSVVNKYFDCWFYFFGEHKPVAVIAFTIPIAIVLLVLAGLNLYKYFEMKNKSKLPDNEEELYAKQEI